MGLLIFIWRKICPTYDMSEFGKKGKKEKFLKFANVVTQDMTWPKNIVLGPKFCLFKTIYAMLHGLLLHIFCTNIWPIFHGPLLKKSFNMINLGYV